MATPAGADDGRGRGPWPRRPASTGAGESGDGALPATQTPRARRRRQWQRRVFGALGVIWLVIGVTVGVIAGAWVVAGLWFGLAALEAALWFMAGRR